MALTGANTYAGGTIVSAGTLLANNTSGSATGSGGVIVNATGILGGIGSINAGANNININDNATITGAKNGTVGALTLTAANVIFGGSAGNLSTYAVDISGTTSDRLNITGVLNLSSAFDQISFNGTADGLTTYVLATYSSETGTFDSMPTLPSGYSLVYGATELDLTPTAVPEPATWAIGALLLGSLLLTHRNRMTRIGRTHI
jgi:autotransporter-associated beta strand protein